MSTTTRTVPEGDWSTSPVQDGRDSRQDVIRTNVLATVGRPGDLHQIIVAPLWGNYFRVNILVGENPTWGLASVRIPHSYFVTVDGQGKLLKSSPVMRREY